MAHSFWVIMQRRSDGRVYADLHKTVGDKFYHSPEEAEADRIPLLGDIAQYFHVVELVAVTAEDWKKYEWRGD